MRIAYFHTGTIFTSWSIFSLAGIMRQAGHEVLDACIPTNEHGAVVHQLGTMEYKRILATLPTLQDLQTCDVVFVAGPEYISVWLNVLYGDQFHKLKAKRAAFYLESSAREDVKFQYAQFTRQFQVNFFPDPEDARHFNAHHLTWYIDTTMFKPCRLEGEPGHVCDPDCEVRRQREKTFSVAFVGSLYNKRLQFLLKLLPMIPEVDFQANGVMVRDLSGERQQMAAELLADNLRRIKIHVALPSNNVTMMVPRPFETLASGTFLITYRTKDNPFKDGEHCRVYDPEEPEELAELIRYYLAHDEERERIARNGYEEVRQKYSWKTRIGEVLDIISRS